MRVMLGMPSSLRMPWIRSDSDRVSAKATLTGSPSEPSDDLKIDNVDLAFETILIEIYRIVTRKNIEQGSEGPKPTGNTTKIVLEKAGSKKKSGCC